MGVAGSGASPWLALCVACAAIAGAAWLTRRRQRQRKQPPSRWRRVGQLSAITLFPLKSGSGISLQEAECTETGLTEVAPARDGFLRLADRFLIAFDDKTGAFRSARQMQRMLHVRVAAAGGAAVLLSAPGVDDLLLELPQGEPSLTRITMWFEEELWAADCGDEAAGWLSRVAMQRPTGLRLGFHLASIPRRNLKADPWKVFYHSMSSADMGRFSDLSSFSVISESSVEELRSRLPADSSAATTLTPRHFRGNLLVQGAPPYSEDTWGWLRVGDTVIFRDVMPCTRCSLTTIHPDTLERNKDMEPLRTLKKYRQVQGEAERRVLGDSPVMGRYLGLHRAGVIRVGDAVYAPA